MIREVIYEIYKIKFMERISEDFKIRTALEWYRFCKENQVNMLEYTYNDYVAEFGFNFDAPICFEEFMDNEYVDRIVMQDIVPCELWDEYLEDLQHMGYCGS